MIEDDGQIPYAFVVIWCIRMNGMSTGWTFRCPWVIGGA
jgi:hypothetical protein